MGHYDVTGELAQHLLTTRGPTNHGRPWEAVHDQTLRKMIRSGCNALEIASRLGRTPYAVECRAKVLELEIAAGQFNPPQPIQSKELNVQAVHLLTLLQEGYTTIHVTFGGRTQTFTYKASLDLGLEVGDSVVVPNNDRFSVGKVQRIDIEPNIDFNAPYALKWVVQKVDFSGYDKQVAAEAAALAELTKAQKRKAQEEALQTLFGTGAKLSEIKAILNGVTK